MEYPAVVYSSMNHDGSKNDGIMEIMGTANHLLMNTAER